MRLQILTLIALAALSCCQRNEPMANEPWASDANYPAGADPWSGTPTKSAPGLSEIAAGHVPGVPDPAEVENWWKNRADTRLAAMESYFVDGDIVLPVDKSVVISGLGEYYHGTRTLQIPACAGSPYSHGVQYTNGGDVIFVSSAGSDYQWTIPIALLRGRRITEIRAIIQDHNTGPTTVAATFVIAPPGSEPDAGVTQTSDGSFPLKKTLVLTGLTTKIKAGLTYAVAVSRASGAQSFYVFGIEVDYDFLPPP